MGSILHGESIGIYLVPASIGKSSICGGSGFPLFLSEWLFTICLTSDQVKVVVVVRLLSNLTCTFRPSTWTHNPVIKWVDFSFQPVLHDWCNKIRGMCYPVCGMVHIKEPLLLIDKSSLCGGTSGFPFSLSEWSLTICLTPYNRR